MGARPQLQFVWPPWTRRVKIVMAVLVAVFLLKALWPEAQAFGLSWLVITPDLVLDRFGLWSLLSHGLWHHTFGHLIMSLAVFYFFGGDLDQRLSARRWWSLVVLGVLAGGALAFVVQLLMQLAAPAMGFGGATTAMVAAYCWLHWDLRMNVLVAELKGKTLLAIFLGLDLLLTLFGGDYPRAGMHLGGAAAGLLVMTGGPMQLVGRWRKARLRRNLKVMTRTPDEKPGARKGKGKKQKKEWIN